MARAGRGKRTFDVRTKNYTLYWSFSVHGRIILACMKCARRIILVGVPGVLVGTLGVLVDVLGVFGIGMVYQLHLVFGIYIFGIFIAKK